MPSFSTKRAVLPEMLEKYTSSGASRPAGSVALRCCTATAVTMSSPNGGYARRVASSSILSGRKPDQWSSSVMTTGAWR